MMRFCFAITFWQSSFLLSNAGSERIRKGNRGSFLSSLSHSAFQLQGDCWWVRSFIPGALRIRTSYNAKWASVNWARQWCDTSKESTQCAGVHLLISLIAKYTENSLLAAILGARSKDGTGAGTDRVEYLGSQNWNMNLKSESAPSIILIRMKSFPKPKPAHENCGW